MGSEIGIRDRSPSASAAGPALVPAADASGDSTCEVGIERLIAQTPPVVSLLGLRDAWEASRGAVLVAVVDSGVDASNAHLADAVDAGADLVDGGDGRTDSSGHGTAVAGQIAARPVDGSGLIGLAPESRILPVRVYADTSAEAVRDGRGPGTGRTAEGIRWAADHGAVIIAVPSSSTSDDPALRASVDYATSRGALVVASAGNADDEASSTAVHFPAGYPAALSVTAVDERGLPSDAVAHGTHVEIAAPGSKVLTTFFGNGDCVFAPSTPTTSYATGYVAAIAALVAAAPPAESPAEWEYRLTATALRPTPSERTTTLGWGIVAPHDALNFTNDGGAVGPQNPLFPAASAEAPRVMPRPDPVVDDGPARRAGVAAICGTGAALVAAIALVHRLRSVRRGRARRR
nr:S8 family serine peptidase [Actinomyces culturomici]